MLARVGIESSELFGLRSTFGRRYYSSPATSG
jgi:hypothetical protein